MPIAERLVVATAIVRHAEVLVACRAYPREVAGQWELPGGKVDDGETVAGAAVREIAEELGCAVQVTGLLDASVLVKPGLRLVAAYAELVAGEPEAREHSDLRWLSPEELSDVQWIDADRAFLPELRERLLDGEPLAGGATGGAVRIGNTVRRTTGAWTPAVHELLAHLRSSPLTPDVLGSDVRDREVLTYLPGATVRPDDETLTDLQVASCGRALRAIHDRLATFRPVGERAWRYGVRALQPGEVICHNDPGVYNWAFDGDDAVGLFDWDMAGPGDPMDDLGFLAWTAIPLYRDVDPASAARRLRLLADAYSGTDERDTTTSAAVPGEATAPAVPRDVTATAASREVTGTAVLHAAHRRMLLACQRIADGINRGDPGMSKLADVGEPGRTRQRLGVLEEHLEAIQANL